MRGYVFGLSLGILRVRYNSCMQIRTTEQHFAILIVVGEQNYGTGCCGFQTGGACKFYPGSFIIGTNHRKPPSQLLPDPHRVCTRIDRLERLVCGQL